MKRQLIFNVSPGLGADAGGTGGPCEAQPVSLPTLIKRWAGVSPKQFISFITVERAKAILEQSAPVLIAALDSGLSGASRLHDQFVSVEAMTPGEYKSCGRDIAILYSFAETPFGRALVLSTDRGICGIEFTDGKDSAALKKAKARWPLSTFAANPESENEISARIFEEPSAQRQPEKPRLLLRGTNFQIQVWSALLRIPEGSIVSYGDIAKAIGKPSASRAVGTALAANTIAFLIPCHRVLRASGLFKSYRWGAPRRWSMLGWEAARREGEHINASVPVGSLAKTARAS